MPAAARSVTAGTADYLRSALEWCLRMSGARRIVVWQMDREQHVIMPVAGAGAALPTVQSAGGDPLDWALAQRVSLRIQPPPVWSDASSVFAVPLVSETGPELLATFEIDDPLVTEPSHFDGLGIYLGSVMGLEMQRLALHREHVHADELIATLRALPSANDTEMVGQQLARAALNLVKGSGSMVALWDGDAGTVIAGEGDGPGSGATFRGTESEASLAARAAATLIRAPGALGRLPLVAAGERFGARPKAMIAVPLKVGDDVIGVVAAWRSSGITPHAVQDLETLAPYAALQLQQAREYGVVRTRAERDALTGLANRHAFENFLAAEAARFDRYQRPFSLIIFDIDYFKQVNDRFGHEAGDFVLEQAGEVIRGSLRSVDFAARLGGEEFVVVLPETGLERGSEIAERVRTRAQELTLQWRGERIDVTLSAGVSAVPDCVPQAGSLVGSADAALYASKRNGRNRVTAAPRRS